MPNPLPSLDKFIIPINLSHVPLQEMMSISTHVFATCVQVNHFCDYQCNYPLWHHVKMT